MAMLVLKNINTLCNDISQNPKTYAGHRPVHEDRQEIDHRRDRVDRLRRLIQRLLVERVERLQLLRDPLVRIQITEGVLERVVISLGFIYTTFMATAPKS